MADGDIPAKKSDLGVRTLSAIVMLAVAGGALWLGGWFWAAFIALISLGVFWEWFRLSNLFAKSFVSKIVWALAGLGYIGVASHLLIELRSMTAVFAADLGIALLLLVVGSVIAVDIGAYFAGRAIGGPKIAPTISPSKTWAGLGGGMIAASILVFGFLLAVGGQLSEIPLALLVAGPVIAIVAQSGDFFESWMKRKAGLKDSSSLIPGHGGLFDRVDGLLAVSFILGVIQLVWDGF